MVWQKKVLVNLSLCITVALALPNLGQAAVPQRMKVEDMPKVMQVVTKDAIEKEEVKEENINAEVSPLFNPHEPLEAGLNIPKGEQINLEAIKAKILGKVETKEESTPKKKQKEIKVEREAKAGDKDVLNKASNGIGAIKLTPVGMENAIPADVLRNVRFSKSAAKVRIVFDLPEVVNYQISSSKDSTVVKFSRPFYEFQAPEIFIGDEAVSKLNIQNGVADSVVTIFTPGTVALKQEELQHPHRLVLDFDKDYEYSIVKEIMPGLIRTDMYSRHNGISQAGHMLEVDWRRYKLVPIIGRVSAMGKNTVNAMVRAAGAIAGINASYFGAGKDIFGVTKLNNQMVSTFYLPRTAFGVKANGEPMIGIVSHHATVNTRLGDYTVAGINSTRSKNGLTLYNNYYGTQTPPSTEAAEVVVVNNKVQEVHLGGGTPLVPGVEVISATGDYKPGFASLQPGENIEIKENFNAPWQEAVEILGVGPALVKNGQVYVNTQEEKIGSDVSYGRSPRTAVGILENGNVLLAVVDGRQSGARGMTLNEFAKLLTNMTVKEAVNFDGGGSTEMVLQGRIINNPSDGSSRYVATSLGVFPR